MVGFKHGPRLMRLRRKANHRYEYTLCIRHVDAQLPTLLLPEVGKVLQGIAGDHLPDGEREKRTPIPCMCCANA